MSRKQTTFDKVYGNIILELNLGKVQPGSPGNMSNQTTTPQIQGTNTSSAPATQKPGVQMKFSPQTPGAASATTNPQQAAKTNVNQDPNKIKEFQNMVAKRNDKPEEFRKYVTSLKPEEIEIFMGYVLDQQTVK